VGDIDLWAISTLPLTLPMADMVFYVADMVCGRCRCNSFSKRRPHHNFFSVRNLASNYLQMLGVDSKLNGLSWIY